MKRQHFLSKYLRMQNDLSPLKSLHIISEALVVVLSLLAMLALLKLLGQHAGYRSQLGHQKGKDALLQKV